MIARRWRVWTTSALADELEPYLQRTGLGDALAVAGSRGHLLLRGDDQGGEVEFTLITFWDSMAAVRAFAGESYDRAVLYDEDARYFTRFDERVDHLRVISRDA
jgi:heme-degrading monooxygenase HmoA